MTQQQHLRCEEHPAVVWISLPIVLTIRCVGFFHRTNQAQGFGILNLAWGIGAIAGPVISGVLAQPCVQYKSSHCPMFLQMHPFLLPCLSATIFSSIAVCASLSLKETNPRIEPKSLPYQKISSPGYLDNEVDPASKHQSASSEQQTKEVEYFKASFYNEAETNVEKFQMKDISCNQKLLVMIPANQQDDNSKDIGCTTPSLSSIEIATGDSADLPRNSSSSPIPSTMSILKDRDVLLSSFCYSMTGLIFIITGECPKQRENH